MENSSNNSNTQVAPVGDWTSKELEVLRDYEQKGVRPLAPSLAGQMFNLFLEGYSCADIAKLNKGLTEGDILFARKKYNWDSERDNYMIQIKNQVAQKVLKQKMESVEFLTNMLSVIHKEHKDVMLRFLQTGNVEDLPKIGSLRTYKEIIETLAKITGEDSVKKLKVDGKIQQETTVKSDGSASMNIPLTPELQTKLLQALVESSQQDTKGKKKSE
jgi:hypothetical protein